MTLIAYTEKSAEPRRKRRGRWIWMFPVLLAIVVWFLPSIATHPTVWPKLAKRVAPELDGKVTIGQAQASWFRPIVIQDVTVRDLQDDRMLEIKQVNTDRSLFYLIRNFGELGTIHLIEPKISLQVSGKSSNLEEFVASITKGDEPKTSHFPTIGWQLQIDNGRVMLTDVDTNRSWQVSQLMSSVSVPSDLENPLTAVLFGVTSDGETNGKISGEANWRQTTAFSWQTPGVGHGALKCELFPVEVVGPLLRRAGVAAELSGYATADVRCDWSDQVAGSPSPAVKAVGIMNLDQVRAIAPDYLGADELQIAAASVTLDGLIQNDVLHLNNIRLGSDFGVINLHGNAPLAELSSQDIVGLLTRGDTTHQYELQGDLDLATLFSNLPRTLKVHEGTEVTNGKLQLQIKSTAADGRRTFSGRVDTSDLAALRDGQIYRWEQPVQVAVNGYAASDGPVFERLQCVSDFISVDGQGKLTEGHISAQGDLDKLAQRLNQFFDLQGFKLSGDMQVALRWDLVEENRIQCESQIDLTNFYLRQPNGAVWQEPQLTVKANGTAILAGNSLQTVNAMTVSVNAGADLLTTILLDPISEFGKRSYPINARLVGDLNSWAARLQPWAALNGWSFAGSVDANVTGEVSAKKLSITESNVVIRQLVASGPSMHVTEPALQLAGVAMWDSEFSRLDVPWLTVAASALAARGEKVHVDFGSKDPTASGQLAFRANSTRINGWFQSPSRRATFRPRGEINGQFQVMTKENTIFYGGQATIANFAYEVPVESPATPAVPTGPNVADWKVLWSEPQVQVLASGGYSPSGDALRIDRLELTGSTMRVALQGQLSALSTCATADISGDLQYDLQALMKQLRSTVGDQIQLFGKRKQPFTIRGPLTSESVVMRKNPVPQELSAAGLDDPSVAAAGGMEVAKPLISPQLTAQAAFGWDRASIYGVEAGPIEVAAQVAQGILAFSPVDLKLAQGNFRLTPRINLNDPEKVLLLEPGVLAEDIQITPEMTQGWLKFVAPLAANATSATGRFSVDLARAEIPVTNYSQGKVTGTVTIHEARLQPGTLASQIVSITDQMSTLLGKKTPRLTTLQADQKWVDIREQKVDFQMADGRVFHRDMTLVFGDVVVKSAGWVGLDQTMSLVATIPIQDKWIDGEAALAGLKGTEVPIPIQGTLVAPRVDQNSLVQLSQQLIGGAAQNYLQGELEKGLQKLLQGR